MSTTVVADLGMLVAMYGSGTLDADEFKKAKAKLLRDSPAPSTGEQTAPTELDSEAEEADSSSTGQHADDDVRLPALPSESVSSLHQPADLRRHCPAGGRRTRQLGGRRLGGRRLGGRRLGGRRLGPRRR